MQAVQLYARCHVILNFLNNDPVTTRISKYSTNRNKHANIQQMYINILSVNGNSFIHDIESSLGYLQSRRS
jgi:hypothetical protein